MRFSDYGEQLVPFTLMKCIIGHYWKWNFLYLNMTHFTATVFIVSEALVNHVLHF